MLKNKICNLTHHSIRFLKFFTNLEGKKIAVNKCSCGDFYREVELPSEFKF